MTYQPPNDEIALQTGGPELLDRVEPLWWQLRQHHADLPTVWRSLVLDSSFDKRRASLLAKAPQGMFVVLASTRGADIGYCVSSINRDAGEVDSIYVIDAHRRIGVGQMMMEPTLEWFDEHNLKSIVVDIMDGNAAAESFYARYGLQRRSVRLQRTNE